MNKRTKTINTNEISKYFICFFMYSVIGWLYEVFLETVVYKWGFSNRGVLFGPYCPIYGFGALAFISVLYKQVKGKDIKTKIKKFPVIFLVSMAITTSIELLASYALEAVIGHWPWQTYAEYKFNFQARIALSPSIRFGLGGALFLYVIQPAFEKLIKMAGEKKAKKISVFMAAVMGIDVFFTVVKLLIR